MDTEQTERIAAIAKTTTLAMIHPPKGCRTANPTAWTEVVEETGSEKKVADITSMTREITASDATVDMKPPRGPSSLPSEARAGRA